MCGCESGDQPKVFESVLRKARGKRARDGYRCCECARLIKHGDWYQEESVLWDSWGSYRVCLRCVARHEALFEVDECQSPYGQVRECIAECLRSMDREEWQMYGEAFRDRLARVRSRVSTLEAARAERYRLASVGREERKKALAWRGSGI
jgi:hypothetical protein